MNKISKITLVVLVVFVLLSIYALTEYLLFKRDVEYLMRGSEMMQNSTNFESGFSQCNKSKYLNDFCYMALAIENVKNNITITDEFCESIPKTKRPYWYSWFDSSSFDAKKSCYVIADYQKNQTEN